MYSTFIKPLTVIYNFLRESFLGVLIDLSLVYFLRVMNRNMYYMYLHWPVNCFHCLGYFIAATSSCHPDLILNETINNFPFNCQNGKLISHDHCHICWTYLGTKQEGEKGLIRPPMCSLNYQLAIHAIHPFNVIFMGCCMKALMPPPQACVLYISSERFSMPILT